MANWYQDQLTNKNFLSPIGFVFVLDKARKVSFLCQKAEIPELSLSSIDIPTAGFAPIPMGGNTINYGDLNLEFIVDEDLKNYMAVHNWLTGLGFPDSAQQFIDLTKDQDGQRDLKEQYSDGALHILNSNFKDVAIVKFKDLFPIYLTSLEFDATESDVNYFTADVTFKYTIYDIVDPTGKLL